MNDKLLPCPFCGGTAQSYETEKDSEYCAQVQCFGCGAEITFWSPWTAGAGLRVKAINSVVERWNTRPPAPSAHVALLKEVVEAMKDACSAVDYVRFHYGELYGVGFARVRDKHDAIIARIQGDSHE